MRKLSNKENIWEINFCLGRNFNNVNDEESDSKPMIMDSWQTQSKKPFISKLNNKIKIKNI